MDMENVNTGVAIVNVIAGGVLTLIGLKLAPVLVELKGLAEMVRDYKKKLEDHIMAEGHPVEMERLRGLRRDLDELRQNHFGT